MYTMARGSSIVDTDEFGRSREMMEAKYHGENQNRRGSSNGYDRFDDLRLDYRRDHGRLRGGGMLEIAHEDKDCTVPEMIVGRDDGGPR